MTTNMLPFSRFTAQSRRALKESQDEVLLRSSHSIEPEHLLLGLLADPENGAVNVFHALGVEPKSVRAAIEAVIQPDEQALAEVNLSPRSKRVIELTVAEVRLQAAQMLDTEHILLGILREEGSACKELNKLGVSLDRVRVETRRLARERSAAMQPVQIDPDRQKQAVAYATRIRKVRLLYLLTVALLAGPIAYLLFQSSAVFAFAKAFIAAGNEVPVLDWQPLSGWFPLLTLFYFILISVVLLSVSLPLTWFQNYFLPHRYGLYKGTARQWFGTLGRGLLLSLTQLWLFVEVVTLFIAIQPQTWWAWAALIQLLYSIIISRYGSPDFMLQMRRRAPLSEGEVARRFQALVERLHIPSCNLYLLRVGRRIGSANAFFAGWGKGRRVLLTDTMLQHFSPDEIEVILAHELAHLVHHDIWSRIAIRGLTFLGLFYLFNLYWYTFIAISALDSPSEVLSRSALSLLSFIVLGVFTSLTRRYRRYQEYRADEFALQTTGNVRAFKDAMTRLTNMGMQVASPNRSAQSALTHPTLLKRLKHADEFAARQKR